ncbi:MAG: HDOD domain-containing protein [bacterium]|nr:HDOD domain-containing protein [bacterium]
MFNKIFGQNKNKLEITSSIELSPGLRSTIMNFLGSRGIPSMPNTAAKAFRLTVDPNSTAKDFIQVIESDESMSARVIRIANSVYFDRGNGSKTIEGSVNIIGLNELRCLLNANSLPELMPSKHPLRAQFWSNDIATAIFARNIAASKNPNLQGTAFLAGLMHDIGKLLLLQRLDSEYAEIIRIVQNKECDFCAAEEEVIAFNHCELGQIIGEKWNFTPDIIEAIRGHHLPWEKLASTPSLSAIVKAADILAHSLGIGHASGFGKFKIRCEAELDRALSIIGVSVDQKREYLQQCQKNFEMESELYLSS